MTRRLRALLPSLELRIEPRWFSMPSSFWCAFKAGGSCVLLAEVTEMLWLHHVGVCDASGREPGGIPEICAWGSI